ncbi:uncharacterized protein Tco025E_01921 [Trypanosoma conorhini]|uniref:Uncharacterized protein n=1 Tax=Trypanosoma conorhini TaxID=83891 RepID=A0A3R7LEY8_9TRYP|nr:uncharacterized protein Tco025E_01921 [Trypanosoma conorhini]RNF25917.1 hypothetical protein Tco025E_01921 [Trypanosoma conorhini]
MDRSLGEASGIVEDVDEFLPGSSLAKDSRVVCRGRLPPRRMVKRVEDAPDFCVPHVSVDDQPWVGGFSFLEVDSFASLPRCRKNTEVGKRKYQSPFLGSVPQEGKARPLRLAGPASPVATPADSSLVDKKNETRELHRQQPDKMTPVPSVTDATFWRQQAAAHLLRDGGVDDVQSSLSGSCGKVFAEPCPVTGEHSLQRHPPSPGFYDEADDIVEDVDDFIFGSPLKRDLCVPVPRRPRQPPKATKTKGRFIAFSSILIPNLSLPGSTVDDTVDSSLVPRPQQHAVGVGAGRGSSKPLSGHSTLAPNAGVAEGELANLSLKSPSRERLVPQGRCPSLSSSRRPSFSRNRRRRRESVGEARRKLAERRSSKCTTKVGGSERNGSVFLRDVVTCGVARANESPRGASPCGDAKVTNCGTQGEDNYPVVFPPRRHSKIQENRAEMGR